ncbi:MAG: methylthioribulose 1-phosphate dehydratase [Vulcanimicrobiaceae bacterium]
MNASNSLITDEVVAQVAAMGRFASERGWVPATSGNFSLRVDERHIAITRSGVDKGSLGPGDIAVLSLDDAIPPGVSAETPLHVARYRGDPAIGAIMHVHSVAATVLSRMRVHHGSIDLQGYEMLKALEGVTTHTEAIALPIFENSQDTPALSLRIEERLAKPQGVPGYLLAGHGMYAWGANAAQARRHVEGLEFLLTCALEEWRLQR